MKVLYISWDGPDQNYMESLFFPLFARMKASGIEVEVLQFLWGPDGLKRSIFDAAKALGIHYEAHTIWRKPLKLATAAMIIRGATEILKVAKRRDIDVLMPRAIIPAAMALLAKPRAPKLKLAFDADGFMADERVDFGGWSAHSIMYRIFRDTEAQMVRASFATITRTQHGKEILTARAGSGFDKDLIHVVPNAKDETVFTPEDESERAATRAHMNITKETPLLVYAGSLGPHYYPDRICAFFSHVLKRRSDAHLIILTGQEDVAKAAAKHEEIPAHKITITRVKPGEVSKVLSTSDLGIAFRSSSFSQRGVCPIKIGEYLLCGTPVLSTRGVGDVDHYLHGAHLGHLLDDLEDQTLDLAASWFTNDVLHTRAQMRAHTRDRGVALFGMSACVGRWVDALKDTPQRADNERDTHHSSHHKNTQTQDRTPLF